jgi:pyruvate formate-lyase activating enzyme-like uncharacterized protein
MIQISTNYYKKKFSAIRRTRYFSLIYSPQDKQSLPNGCKYCVKGEKTVLFVTGLCPKNCFYCPISDEKKNNDVIFFNELQMDSNQDNDKLLNAYIKEANSHFSKGAGITGGDPLASIERTCFFISSLKQKFGKTYHIHLYTSLDLVSDEKLFSLKKAGLDEIRFHIDVFDKKYWNRLELLNKYNFDVGIEIPLIPPLTNYLLYCNLLDFVKDKVDFINLNELETSDSSYNTILEKGYIVKNRYSKR